MYLNSNQRILGATQAVIAATAWLSCCCSRGSNKGKFSWFQRASFHSTNYSWDSGMKSCHELCCCLKSVTTICQAASWSQGKTRPHKDKQILSLWLGKYNHLHLLPPWSMKAVMLLLMWDTSFLKDRTVALPPRSSLTEKTWGTVTRLSWKGENRK